MAGLQCKVRRLLLSVSKITAAGNIVHLSPNNAHIPNHKTRQVTKITKRGNVYVVDLWVKGPPKPPAALGKRARATRHGGHGRVGLHPARALREKGSTHTHTWKTPRGDAIT